ncbi:MAG: hypothetical protein Q9184_003746 [Pyrenodesmia sp. 2 TL-2023]
MAFAADKPLVLSPHLEVTEDMDNARKIVNQMYELLLRAEDNEKKYPEKPANLSSVTQQTLGLLLSRARSRVPGNVRATADGRGREETGAEHDAQLMLPKNQIDPPCPPVPVAVLMLHEPTVHETRRANMSLCAGGNQPSASGPWWLPPDGVQCKVGEYGVVVEAS